MRVGDCPVQIDVVVISAFVDVGVSTLRVGEGGSGLSRIPARDEGLVYGRDGVRSDEEVHVDAPPKVRRRVNRVCQPGALEQQQVDVPNVAQHAAELGAAETLDQYCVLEPTGGLIADLIRQADRVPEDVGKQDVNGMRARTGPKFIELVVRERPRKRLLRKCGTEQRIEHQRGTLRVHPTIVSFWYMYRLRKIASLPYRDRLILIEAIVFAIPVELGLRWIGFDTLVKRLGRARRSLGRQGPVDGEQAARLVEAASRFYPFELTCLKKSLVLFWIFRRRGLPAELCIGVKKEVGGEPEAHAWIQCGGRLLLDGDIAHQFAPMPLNI